MWGTGTEHEIVQLPVVDRGDRLLPYGFDSFANAVRQRWNVAGGDEPVVEDEHRHVTVQLVLVVVRTVAVVVNEADLRRNEHHLCRSHHVVTGGRSDPLDRGGGGRQRVERATDVVDAEFEDCARSNHHFGSDAAERAAMNRCDVVTTQNNYSDIIIHDSDNSY